jgi:hypothetical protein
MPLLPSAAPGHPAGNDTASDSLPGMWQGNCHRVPSRRPAWREQADLARQDHDVGRSRAWAASQASRPVISRRVFAAQRSGN